MTTTQTLPSRQALTETTIRDLVERYPAVMAILEPLGIDLCCGGAHPLGEALRLHGFAEEPVLDAVERAIAPHASSAGVTALPVEGGALPFAPRPLLERSDFSRQPFVLAWELTRACNLACVHCRAEAQLRRDPRELTTEEALRVIDEIARFDVPPVLILTGGDPMRRPDLLDLIRHATRHGIRCTLTPAGTPLASKARLAAAQEAGLRRIAVSIDGSHAARHDAFRRVDGSFDWTLKIVAAAHELGLPVQIHSTLCQQTVDDFPALADLADELRAVVWAVFCLVPTGRAEAGAVLSPEEHERVFEWLVERSSRAGWELKLTEGYHYRRVLSERSGGPIRGLGFASGDGIGRAPRAVNAGNGFCFISHIGEVCPSGFLPVVTGNVRTASVVDLYREHPVFQSLRDASQLRGKCGACGYREICGGSRSRAHAATGDYLASDPACVYQPTAQPNWTRATG